MTTTETDPKPKARSVLPIDPRIRARRVQVKRDEGRRRLRFLLVTSSAALAVGIAALATRSPLLDVDHLTVTGAGHTPATAVLAAARLRRGVAMTDVQSGAAVRRVERLPWVDQAHLVKRWPATVTVTVTERKPIALVRSGAGWAIVDHRRRVLDSGSGPGAAVALPVVVGAGALSRPGSTLPVSWDAALRVAGAVPTGLVGQIGSITTTDNDELELHLVPSGLVRFGPPEDIDQKLTSLATLLTQVKLRGSVVIDVRVPDAPAVTAG